MANKAIIAGASGLTGGELLTILLKEPYYSEVVILVRKPLPIEHKKLVQLVVDFDKLHEIEASINGHALFCCLGTTKNKTPDKDLYIKIEHGYPVQLAQMALNNGIRQFHLMSSVGANSASGNLYLKWKGQTEDDIQRLPLPTLHIYQPSLLTGSRKEYRLIEKLAAGIMKLVNPLLIGSLAKYVSIPAALVASAMHRQSLKNEAGVFKYPSNKIKELA